MHAEIRASFDTSTILNMLRFWSINSTLAIDVELTTASCSIYDELRVFLSATDFISFKFHW
ncbi:MAG: hypothetical protein QXR42_03380 [Candidatus Bathyarchaeia archaeon]